MADINSLINTIRTGVYGSDIREAIADALAALAIKSVSGAGWTTDQINLLNDILSSLAYVGTSGQDKVAALITSLKTTKPPVIPDDPSQDDPSNPPSEDPDDPKIPTNDGSLTLAGKTVYYKNGDASTTLDRLTIAYNVDSEISGDVGEIEITPKSGYEFDQSAAVSIAVYEDGSLILTIQSSLTAIGDGSISVTPQSRLTDYTTLPYAVLITVSGLKTVASSEKITVELTDYNSLAAAGVTPKPDYLVINSDALSESVNKITIVRDKLMTGAAYKCVSKAVLEKKSGIWQAATLNTQSTPSSIDSVSVEFNSARTETTVQIRCSYSNISVSNTPASFQGDYTVTFETV